MSDTRPQQTDMSPAEIADRVWELIDRIGFCMFVTWDGTQIASRPLSSRVARDAHAIHFLVSAGSSRSWHIDTQPRVNLAYADTGAMKFVSLSGTAALDNDRAKIAELWSAFDKAWWDDADDPDIRLLTVTPESAELWDSPNKAVAFAAMLGAAVTGGKPKLGDNATTQL